MNMLTKMAAVSIFSVLLLGLATPVFAHENDSDRVDLEAQREKICNITDEKPLVDVRHKVINNGDSGVKGNTWGNDSYKKEITIWKQVDGSFCAEVSYDGKTRTWAGDSPNGTGIVGEGIVAKMEGGYIATLNGTFAPSKKVRGDLGKFDYQCAQDYNSCQGFDWVGAYFTNSSNFAQPYWAWTYETKRNGTWLNASTGNMGDITGILAHPDQEEDD